MSVILSMIVCHILFLNRMRDLHDHCKFGKWIFASSWIFFIVTLLLSLLLLNSYVIFMIYLCFSIIIFKISLIFCIHSVNRMFLLGNKMYYYNYYYYIARQLRHRRPVHSSQWEDQQEDQKPSTWARFRKIWGS